MSGAELALRLLLQLTCILLARRIITPTLFTMMALMAIGTTVMTGPLVSLVWEPKRVRLVSAPHGADPSNLPG